jgi:hypothetical protein
MIMPDAHVAEPDIKIRESHHEQTAPRKQHVAFIEAAYAIISLLAGARRF